MRRAPGLADLFRRKDWQPIRVWIEEWVNSAFYSDDGEDDVGEIIQIIQIIQIVNNAMKISIKRWSFRFIFGENM